MKVHRQQPDKVRLCGGPNEQPAGGLRFLDYAANFGIGYVAKFGFDAQGNPHLAELLAKELQPSDAGEIENWGVLLTAGIAGVFVQLVFAVVSRNPALGDDVGESEPTDTGEFCRLAEGQQTPRVQGGSKLLAHTLLGLGLRNAEALRD